MTETTVSPARKTDAANAAKAFYEKFGIKAADLRKWAIDNGLEVPARGRLHPDVFAAYGSAHA